MSRPRKYPKTTGHYNYAHILQNKMCYFGRSKQQPSKRWRPSVYKNTALQPGIEEFGWDNIEHIVIQDGLSKRQSEVLEDWLIKNATKDGFCLNDRRSGGIERDNLKEYKREYSHTDKYKEYHREYDKKRNQTEKRKEYLHEYYKTEKYKEYNREYMRQYRLKKKQGI